MPAPEQTGHVLARLLDLYAPRPTYPSSLVDHLRARLASATADSLRGLGRDLFWSKTRHGQAGKCVGLAVAAADAGFDPTGTPPEPVITGWIVHAAVQGWSVCPGLPLDEYVRGALSEVRRTKPGVDAWVRGLDVVAFAALVTAATNALASWAADWPPFDRSWGARWEVHMRARVGDPDSAVVLVSRPDLLIGRPRAGRSTMLIVDLKTGPLRDDHSREARFHSLVSALRFNTAPWRSVVYSTVTGSWSMPADVSEETLMQAVDEVAAGVTKCAAAAAGEPVELTPGTWCAYCPAADDCPEATL